MRIFKTFACVWALLVLAACLLSMPDLSFAESKKILILHSYHQSSKWTERIHHGMMEVLDRSGLETDIHVEYMDCERQLPAASFKYLEEYYRSKYVATPFDVILLSDNSALSFILSRRDKLFPGVPVVFCGVNNFTEDQLMGQTGITGINEDVDIKATISLALRLKPDIREFLVINDRTETGQVNRDKFEQDVAGFPFGTPRFELMDDFTMEELKIRLEGLQEDSALLVLTLRQSKEGRLFNPEEYSKFISEHCSVPIFTLWGSEMDTGVLGGVMVSGMEQGKKAAEYGVRILKGEALSSLPVVMKSPNVSMIDYRRLGEFNIPEEAVPAGTRILYKPESVFEKYSREIWGAVLVFIVLIAVIVALAAIGITRKRTARALAESEEKLGNALDMAHLVHWEYDVAGDLVTFSDQFHRVYRTSRKTGGQTMLLADYARRYVHPEDIHFFAREVRTAIETADPQYNRQLEYRMRYGDGGAGHMAVRFFVGKDAQGKTIRLCGVNQDITERKRVEAHLRQAQKMEAIGTLAEGISHDFNNILQPLMGYCELLKEELTSDSPLQELVNGIFSAAGRAGDLLGHILIFSRQDKQETLPLKIQPIISEAMTLMRSTLPETIAIRQELDPDCGIVLADPTYIYQIVMNLCTNAYHAMEAFGGTLTVSLRQIRLASQNPASPEMAPGEYALLKVSDTGPGIPSFLMEKIFDPYFSTKEKTKGSGLGLSMVRGIVKRCSGDIRILSEPGKGTEVYVYLRLGGQGDPGVS